MKKAMGPVLAFGIVCVMIFAFAAIWVSALSASSGNVGTGVFTALPILISMTWVLYLSVTVAKTAGMRLAGGEVLTLDEAGFHATILQGTVTIPWAAVASIRIRRRRRHSVLSFSVAPDVKAESPGLTTTLRRQDLRALVKRGFQLGSAGIDVPTQTIADAAAAFTSGRLIAR